MVDTVRFRLRGCTWRSDAPMGFLEFKYQAIREYGVYVTRDERGYVWVSVSLPRFLYGYNGFLISNQMSLNTALHLVLNWLRNVFTEPKELVFTRVDLCWQFSGDIDHFIASHQSCIHPLIRGTPFLKARESIKWGSRSAKMKIGFYDKFLESIGRRGNVVRVEVTLSGTRLREQLAADRGPVKALDFETCYAAFRRILCRFSPVPTVLNPGRFTVIEMMALGEQMGWNHNGQSCVEIYISSHYKNSRRARGFRDKVAAAKLQFGAVRWEKLLPTKEPPCVLDALIHQSTFSEAAREF